MDRRSITGRRQFLAATSVGAAGLAGCADLGGSSDDSENPLADSQSPEPTGEGVRTVSIIVQPNPTALQEAQTEVVSRLEDGDLDQEEAEAELADQEQELIEAAIADAIARVDEVGAVHTDTVDVEGTLLVEGEADDLLDLLGQPSISAILSEERFEQAQQRAGAEADADSGALPEQEEPTDGNESTVPAPNESNTSSTDAE
ncbi:hypothetical protein G6M89_16995 [Natronolimnobius sp. AArcel1]|uniref:hypothetical protein n=1 Tax=Natronolimnobius sp. AArcel1 TaxID=1679093 RepID=UPI0013ECF238|nr:hypothetical protein [Natronolimnobius sp. AArcel1]NGM70682.1 hypothetical protein [Natronolimnobius sp. AArcel1]